MALFICDTLRNFAPFVQFKNHEKHLWRSFTFCKVAGFEPVTLLNVTLLDGCFSRFLNCTNGTKSRKASHIIKSDHGMSENITQMNKLVALCPDVDFHDEE